MIESYHRDDVYIQNQSLFRNIFRATLKKVLKYKKKGSVLEVGSSTGLLLTLFLEAGWDVTGVEPSKKSSEYARNRGIRTINETFEKAVTLEKYDVIVFNHVLEHLKDPEEVLKKAYGLLKDDGILVINVPNAGSLSARVYKKNWKYLLPEEHLWQFTPGSLRKLLTKQKFSILEWEAKSGIWEFDNPLAELVSSFVGFKKRFFENFLTAIPTWFISKAKFGTGLSITAKKNV